MYDFCKNAFIISHLALLFPSLYLRMSNIQLGLYKNESFSNALETFLPDYERQIKMIIDVLHLYNEF